MLVKKKKLSKKQIKEDKLVTTYYQAQKFYEDNQSRILMVVGAIAVVVVAIFWYNSKVTQDNLAATTELSRVIPLYEDGLFQEAIEGRVGTNIIGLKKITGNYGGTDQGEVARIYLANSYYNLGQYDEAMEQYDEYSGSNGELVGAALAGKAACYEAKGEYASAAEFYKKAAAVSELNPLNAEYLVSAGKNFLEVGEKEKAADVLNQVKENYENSQAATKADRYLAVAKYN